jgi:hypothetical protein
MNAEWHDAHVLGKGAAMDARVAWHLAHVQECGCRDLPRTVREEVERRGVTIPERAAR